MGFLCGWSGIDTGLEASRQAIESMLGNRNSCPACAPEKACSVADGLAISEGLYHSSYAEQDGLKAAVIGTPRWSDRELSDFAKDHNLAASLIKAYHDHGPDLLTRLHGPFALAILDDHAALIAIDRIGIHTLSFAYQNGALIFSTTTGSVASHPQVPKRIDPQAIFNFLYFRVIPSPGTVYHGIEKLLPGQYIHLCEGRIKKGFYWRLHYNDHTQTSFQTEKQRFYELMRASVGANIEHGTTAAFLSGGTDSSTVTGMLAEFMSDPVDTYSIGFAAEGFDEMEYARLAAGHFGATAHEYYLKPDDILEAVPVIVNSYDEPFGNESAVPTYFCAKRAAEDGVKIMLAGDGGDEIFGGNARYAKQMVFEHFTRLPKSIRQRLIEPIVFGFPGGDGILPVRKFRSYIRQAKIPLPERMESYNFIYRQPLEEIFDSEFLSSVDPEMPETLLRETYARADSTHPINRMLHLDMKFTLADNDLRKVSRMCEVAGIEVRYPILDEALVAFSATLPHQFKVRGQKLRWFFKEALKNYLPQEIINKSKHGFGLPFGVWTLTHPPLKALVDETLTRFEDRGYMQPEYIHTIRRLHADEHPTYYGSMIWAMFMLEQWLTEHAA